MKTPNFVDGRRLYDHDKFNETFPFRAMGRIDLELLHYLTIILVFLFIFFLTYSKIINCINFFIKHGGDNFSWTSEEIHFR